MSEVTKPRPNARVVAFFQGFEPRRACLSVLTLGELHRGISQQAIRQPSGTARLKRWLKQLEESFAERILAIDRNTALRWGELSAARTLPVVDSLLAATALHHRLVLVTRNTRDMEGTGVLLYNPWDDPDLD